MTPKEFLTKYARNNLDAVDDFASIIAAAVAAEHQRTKVQAAQAARETGERQHEVHISAECDFSDMTGERIALAIEALP